MDIKVEYGNYDTYDSDYVNELVKKHSLPVNAIEAPDTYTQKDIEKLIKFAKEISCKIIVVSAPSLLSFSLTKWLKKEVPKIRRKENISIALENAKDETYLGIIPKKAMNNILEMKKFKHACIDISLLADRGSDIIRTYNNLKDFLVHVHISNSTKKEQYARLKSGTLPVESLLSKLKDNNYLGAISIKVSPKEFELKDKEEVVKGLKEELEFCNKYVK